VKLHPQFLDHLNAASYLNSLLVGNFPELCTLGSRYSTVATVIRLWDGRFGVRIPSTKHLYRLWGPPNLLFTGVLGLFPQQKSSSGRESIIHSPRQG